MKDVFLLPSAHIASKNAVLIENGGEGTTEIGCFSFLIRLDGEWILLDTGIEDLTIVNQTKSSVDDWKRGADECDILSCLARHNVRPEEIKKVFLTHSHYDHLSGITHFPRAQIYMSRAEYDFLLSGNPHRGVLKEQIAFLKTRDLHLFETDGMLAPGVHAAIIGGHTPGSTMYAIDDVLFTGDNVFLLRSIKENRPIGFCLNPQEAARALAVCRAHKGPVFTSHDKECLTCLI